MLSSDVAIVDIIEYHVKHFEVIVELLREATGFSNRPTQSLSKTAVITFYAHRVLFANLLMICFKGG